MKHLRFYFDLVSPYAYLAFERLPQALEGLSVEVSYQPVLFAGLLQHWENKGPAEIEPKRAWTFRQVAWLAHEQGATIDAPVQRGRELPSPELPNGLEILSGIRAGDQLVQP